MTCLTLLKKGGKLLFTDGRRNTNADKNYLAM